MTPQQEQMLKGAKMEWLTRVLREQGVVDWVMGTLAFMPPESAAVWAAMRWLDDNGYMIEELQGSPLVRLKRDGKVVSTFVWDVT